MKHQTIIFEVVCDPSAAIATASDSEQLFELIDGMGGQDFRCKLGELLPDLTNG